MAKLGDVMDYLKHNNVQYEVIEHVPAFSAHEVAVVSHVPERPVCHHEQGVRFTRGHRHHVARHRHGR